MATLQVKLIIGMVVVLLATGGWIYYKNLKGTIEDLRMDNSTLTVALDQNEATITELQKNQGELIVINREVQDEFNEITTRVENLNDRLTKYDVGVLAKAKPKLVERAVNNGTADSNRCFEILSGVPLTEDEINATKKSQANSICADIANPNYVPK